VRPKGVVVLDEGVERLLGLLDCRERVLCDQLATKRLVEPLDLAGRGW
jgi:hypothetical protein